jgi:Cu(I)/Ag(I) efflux system protein CusF
MKQHLLLLALSLSFLAGVPARAEEHGHDMGRAASTRHRMVMSWSEGIVKKVNPARGKLTIAHGPLKNLGMPAMTMIFRVKDPAWLSQVKPGDHIRFVADEVHGALTVTRFEHVR